MDLWLFKQINTGLASPALDGVMVAASAVGTGAAQAAMSLCFAVYGWIADQKRLRRAGYAGVIAAIAAGIVVQLAKLLWDRPRPLASLYDVRLVGAPLFGKSFPSGHAMTAFAVAAAISVFAPRARWVLYPLAALTAISRVYSGVHFPLDVVFGAAMGILVGMWSANLARPKEERPTSPGPSFVRRGDGSASPLAKGGARWVGTYVLLAGVCLVLFLWRLGGVPLIGLDEGLYSECAREMAAGGSWIVPTCNGEPFYDKPPLAYWLMAASIRAFGVNSFAARLPSAVAATALVALTALIGTNLFGRRAGLVAGYALATSIMTAALARMALLDMLFALVITAALGAFLLARLGLVSHWWYLVSWAAGGLSMLVKGPAGVVLIGAALVAFLIASRGRPSPSRPLSHSPPLAISLIAGVALFVVVAAPWYVLAQRETGGEFLREFIVHQNLQRALGNDFQHNMPFYFYLPVYLMGFFPWSVFVPLAWARYVKRRPDDAAGEASLFAGIWLVVMVVIFSVSRSKLPAYIYPVYPASALLVGRLWSEAIEHDEAGYLRRYGVATVILALVVGAALLVGARFLPKPIPGLGTTLAAMALSLALGASVAFGLVTARRPGVAFGALCAGEMGFALAAMMLGVPLVAGALAVPAATLGEHIRRTAPPEQAVFAYQLSPPQPALAFYAQRPVPVKRTPEELRDSVREMRSWLVVTQRDRLDGLPEGGKPVLQTGRYVVHEFGR